MPFIRVSTSAKIDDKKKLLEEISILISSLTNKSKRFVMAKLDDNLEIYFDDESPCCLISKKQQGLSSSKYISELSSILAITNLFDLYVKYETNIEIS